MHVFARSEISQSTPMAVSIRCPACRKVGMFSGMQNVTDATWQQNRSNAQGQTHGVIQRAGTRRCPNTECRAIVFVAIDGSKIAACYPPEVIDFDSTDLPATILETLTEATICHAAGAYKASALMVRRLLEELCADRQATGKDLKTRLALLGSAALIPKELLDAADELRVLGNDAAHIEAKAYDNIGKEEAEIAIELAKELLKAVYQYSSLVSKLKALRKPSEQ